MDRIEFEEFFLLKRRFQVSVALLGPGAKPAEHALFHLLRYIVSGELLLPLPRRNRVERGVPPHPMCHNMGLRALPADRLQRREERLGVGVVVSTTVTLLFEELPHLATERRLHRTVWSAYPAEDEPAPFGAEHTHRFGGRVVYVDVMKRTRREDRRHASVLGGPATVAVGHEELSAELRLLHLLPKDREHRRGAIEADVADWAPEEGEAQHAGAGADLQEHLSLPKSRDLGYRRGHRFYCFRGDRRPLVEARSLIFVEHSYCSLL